jgi:anthranilate synthase / indole-3-glycerol phosphate synthase / phosphoribosylanthranilate isomerase
LHGEEPIEFARWVGVPVVKAFGLGGGEGGEVRRPGYHLFVLIDSVVNQGEGEGDGEGERVNGGTGMTCDWTKARQLVNRGEIVVDQTLILPSSEVVEVGEV